MPAHRTRRARGTALAAVTALALAAGLTGCSDDSSPESVVSDAASAASSLASKAGDVLASATAEAGKKLDQVDNGVDVKGDVRLGKPATDSQGRTTVEVTASNTDSEKRSFAVEVDFEQSGGGLLDVVVVTVPDVAAGKTGTATARSTHKLSGDVKAYVGRALRY
ncbi:hypothetical protein [Streptomyces griseus]|uniref:hypothetical protein n=1 Tax=Streptomyces griseus TaxID=1911 RepID=UPI00055A0F4F|nr:hypothetical protein [Streptomyces griseus]